MEHPIPVQEPGAGTPQAAKVQQAGCGARVKGAVHGCKVQGGGHALSCNGAGLGGLPLFSLPACPLRLGGGRGRGQ